MDPPERLRGRLGFVLGKAAQRATALMGVAPQPHGLKVRHYGVLTALAEQNGQTQQALGARLRIDRTTMAAALDDLERLGLAARQPHPSDRRAHHVSLTEAGCSALAALEPGARQAEAALEADLSPQERAQLVALLSRVASAGPG